jgi:two-component system, NtrC family, sensor kinase
MTQDGNRLSHYKTISRRVAMIVIATSLAPLILVTGIILYRFNTFSHEMVHAHVEEMVLKHKHNIDFFLQEKLSDIRHLSRSFDLEDFKDEAFLRQRLQILQEEYSAVFVDLGIIDQSGQQVAYAGPFRLEQAFYGDAAWFKEAIDTKHYISDVFLGLREQPHFIVTTNIQGEDNTNWILRATIDFYAFNLIVENLHVGETGSAFILNRHGDFQTRPPTDTKLAKRQYLNLFERGRDMRLVDVDTSEWAVFPDIKGWNPRSDGIAEQVISVEKVGTHNRRVIIVAAFLKDNEWLLIFQQEADDAYAKLNRTQKIAALILFFGALGIIMVSFLLSRQMEKRIARVDSEKEMMNKQIVETGKLATIGELAAGIAHEINNPVAIMVEEAGWIQDLLDEGIEKADNLQEFQRALAQIGTQGIRCKEITHKLLSFARKTDSTVHAIQLNELIEETVSLSSQKSRYASVEIHTNLDPDLPDIQASATEMQQVLMNIINNAIDAMEKKGGRLDISTEEKDNWITIVLQDNGPGIPESNLNRIFDPFFTTKPVGKGTGLGLSICYGIVQKMGGRIDVESGVDLGSKFSIVLPVNNSTEEE